MIMSHWRSRRMEEWRSGGFYQMFGDCNSDVGRVEEGRISDMKTRKQVAVSAVLSASKLCQHVHREMVSSDTVQKNDRSPVTIADYGAQALICQVIKDVFADDVIVAEEDADSLRQNYALMERVTDYVNRSSDSNSHAHSASHKVCEWIDKGKGEISDRFWTLDPIDGTKGFLRNNQYAIALAWIENSEVQLGILACPNLPHQIDGTVRNRGCLFVAVRGEGTVIYDLDGERLGVAKVSNKASRLAESFESAHGDSNTHSRIAKKIGLHQEPLKIDSQAKYGIVARGEASLYIRLPNPKFPDYRECIWDHAAGMIVVEEAGGKVTDANGLPLSLVSGRRMTNNHGVVATNGTLHAEVLSIISDDTSINISPSPNTRTRIWH